MLFDLSGLTLLVDLFESLGSVLKEGSDSPLFSVYFLAGLLAFISILYFVWRSTEVPDHPPPPRPPYHIQLGPASPSLTSLADVRLLRSGPNVDYYHWRQPQTRSLFGLIRRQQLRPAQPRTIVSRSRLSTTPNLIVYHRVNVYHHSHRQGDYSFEPRDGSHGIDNLNSTPLSEEELSQQNVNVLNVDVNVNVDVEVEDEREEEEEVDVDVNLNLDLGHSEERLVAGDNLDLRLNVNVNENVMERRRSEGAPPSPQTPKEDSRSSPWIQEPSRAEESIPGSDQDIRVTLKFLNDTQIEVVTQLTEKIVDFKRRHFERELAENKVVRLIFNGRVLDNDGSSLRESGIFDQCVVHCLIVIPQPRSNGGTGESGGTQRVRPPPRGTEPGFFFVAIMGVILVFLWFVCFHFGQQLFTQSAVVSLTVLTAIFLIGLVAFYLPINPNNPQQPNNN